jgi:hypothetical protein
VGRSLFLAKAFVRENERMDKPSIVVNGNTFEGVLPARVQSSGGCDQIGIDDFGKFQAVRSGSR